MEAADDRYRFILERPVATPPGTAWSYRGGATAILAHLISRGTGRPLLDHARDRLFDPLGIGDVAWDARRQRRGGGGLGLAHAAARPGANRPPGERMRARQRARPGAARLGRGDVDPAGHGRGQHRGRAAHPVRLSVEDRPFPALRQAVVRRLRQRRPAPGGGAGPRPSPSPSTAGNYNDANAWRVPVGVFVEVVLASFRE